MIPPTKEVIQAAFQRLIPLLASTPLKNEDGTTRIAELSEFMFMQIDQEGNIGFKHCDSRNYIFLLKNNTLHVPETSQAFQRGTFDVFEEPQLAREEVGIPT